MQVTDQPRHQPSPAPGRNASTHRWDDEPTIPRTPAPGPRRPIGHTGDSDPDADELLKRARQPRGQVRAYPGNCPVCHRSFAGCICGSRPYTARAENAGVRA